MCGLAEFAADTSPLEVCYDLGFHYFVAVGGLTRRVRGRCFPLKPRVFFRLNSFVAFDGWTRRVCGRCLPLKGRGLFPLQFFCRI